MWRLILSLTPQQKLRMTTNSRVHVAEMGWLRKLVEISKRQKKKNEDIRTELNQTETLVQKNKKTQITVVWAC